MTEGTATFTIGTLVEPHGLKEFIYSNEVSDWAGIIITEGSTEFTIQSLVTGRGTSSFAYSNEVFGETSETLTEGFSTITLGLLISTEGEKPTAEYFSNTLEVSVPTDAEGVAEFVIGFEITAMGETAPTDNEGVADFVMGFGITAIGETPPADPITGNMYIKLDGEFVPVISFNLINK